MTWPPGTPNPGSDEAVTLSCVCARLDNGRGRADGAPMLPDFVMGMGTI